MMRQLLGKRLSTLLLDTETYPARTLLRVSLWAEPEEVEITDDDPAKPTINVAVRRGRTIVYGTIDREAWDEVQGLANEAKPFTTAPVDRHREQMYRR